MGVFELLVSLVGSVSAIVRTVREIRFRPPLSEPQVIHVIAVQPVFVITPSELRFFPVVLTPDTRELLEIPGSSPGNLIRPRLVLADAGLISPADFVGCALDELVFRADPALRCVECGRLRRAGGFFKNEWRCADHLPGFLRKLATGAQPLPWGTAVPRAQPPQIPVWTPTVRAVSTLQRLGLRDAPSPSAVSHGVVKSFDEAQGFGYLSQADGPDVFVHSSEIRAAGARTLHKGDHVQFETEGSRYGPRAKNVVKLKLASRS